MNIRLQQFLTLENLTPARLADILGVQRSGMSHILSGRNKPGYDFILKMCTKFPDLNANWFITGKGKPYKDSAIVPDSETQAPLSQPHQNSGIKKNVGESIYKNHQQVIYNNNDIIKENNFSNQENSPILADDDFFAPLAPDEQQNLSEIQKNGGSQFSDGNANNKENIAYFNENQSVNSKNNDSYPRENQINGQTKESAHKKKSVKRVIIFYNDGSFEELFPTR